MTDVLQPKMAGSGIEWIGTRTWKAIKDGTLKTRSLPAETGRRREEPEQAPFLNGKSREGTDEVDALPETLRYNWFDLLCTLISIGREPYIFGFYGFYLHGVVRGALKAVWGFRVKLDLI